jgi:FAD/FMN-containing dehydrogenase
MPLRHAIRDFAGEVLLPGDPDFDDARRTQNDAVDRRPALIARCGDAQDVAAALRYARAAGLVVRVRGGGHGPDGFAVADDALVIDLTAMRAVRVDPAGRRVRVQGGATWREVDAATQAHGLAVTGARIPSVGVAGFTLGSGSGWLERKLGLAADSLRAARIVTAQGHVVTTGGEDHPDLFWALRGGGPSFGVAAELEFALHPVGLVTGGLLAWPARRAAEVADAYAELLAEAPDDLGGALALLNAPPAPFVPEHLHGTPIVAVVVLWTGAGPAPLASLRASGPVIDTVERMPYRALQGLFESPDRYTARVHGIGGFFSALTPELAGVLGEAMARKPAQLGSILVQPLGGAVARVPNDATPLGQRDAPWAWQAGAAWFDSAHDDAVAEWMAGLRAAVTPYARGDAWPNFIPEQDPERLRAAYGPAVWQRLQAIRSWWDPHDVFAGGHAITLPRA